MKPHTENLGQINPAPNQEDVTGLPKQRKSLAMLAIIATLFIATLSISGCVGLTSAGSPTKPGSSSAPGVLAPSATTVNFGNVRMGSTSLRTLTLTNTGTAAVMISDATVFGSAFRIIGVASAVSLAPGETQPLQVEFAPKAGGSSSGSLVVASDASDPALTLPLSGTSIAGPSITTEPANQSVAVGQKATFDVIATGSGTLTYQWNKNAIAIAGATSASYTTPASTNTDSGASFTVTVSDAAGSATSNAATLTVTAAPVAPSITGQPLSKSVTAGQTATFAVTATGTATLTYQWKKNGAAISGATSASYTTPATSTSDSGASFAVTVNNSTGSVTSNAATLTVTAAPVAPSITTQPVSKSVIAGQTAGFTVAATGSGTLTYQWKKNGSAISGATSPSYTTTATTASDDGASFTVTVGDAAGSVTSNPAVLTVTAAPVAPSITGQPASKSVTAGQTASFAVTATGTATLTYQWKKNGAAISGATSASYTTAAASTSDNGAKFTVTVTNSTGSATSNAATLTVGAATSLLNGSTTSLNFSSVSVGSNRNLGVTFTNAGNSDVTVSNVTIAGAGFAASGVSTGQILTPGQTASLNVSFTPASAASVNGSVTVASNATNSPATITLSGAGVPAAASHSATLNWVASTSTVAGYNVYRSDVSGGAYAKLNAQLITSTQYPDSTVLAGQNYFYVVTSADSSGVESVFSNEASAVIPTP